MRIVVRFTDSDSGGEEATLALEAVRENDTLALSPVDGDVDDEPYVLYFSKDARLAGYAVIDSSGACDITDARGLFGSLSLACVTQEGMILYGDLSSYMELLGGEGANVALTFMEAGDAALGSTPATWESFSSGTILTVGAGDGMALRVKMLDDVIVLEPVGDRHASGLSYVFVASGRRVTPDSVVTRCLPSVYNLAMKLSICPFTKSGASTLELCPAPGIHTIGMPSPAVHLRLSGAESTATKPAASHRYRSMNACET